MTSSARPAFGFALGFTAVLGLNVAVVGIARLVQADALEQMASMGITLFIGAIQLLWALPLAWVWRKRRGALAGVATAVLATGVVNYLGLRN